MGWITILKLIKTLLIFERRLQKMENYYPNHRKVGIDIPDFITKRQEKNAWEQRADQLLQQNNLEAPTYDSVEEAKVAQAIVETSQNLAQAAQYGAKIRKDGYHLKELDATVDAMSEEEARVAARRLVTNHPTIVLAEVSTFIDDMQQLAQSILHNSKAFASRRSETPM